MSSVFKIQHIERQCSRLRLCVDDTNENLKMHSCTISVWCYDVLMVRVCQMQTLSHIYNKTATVLFQVLNFGNTAQRLSKLYAPFHCRRYFDIFEQQFSVSILLIVRKFVCKYWCLRTITANNGVSCYSFWPAPPEWMDTCFLVLFSYVV